MSGDLPSKHTSKRMWFSKSIDETLKNFNVEAASGLSDQEAAKRLRESGPNKLDGKKRKSILQMFFSQLNDALIYVLFGAVVITLFMGEYVDAIIITLVIVINAVLGVIQEVKAGNAIEALRDLSTPSSLVRRNGETKEISSEEVVVGDIVLLDAGRVVPADLRLIEAANLQIDESALTGESVPSQKDADQLLEGNPALGDRINLAFMSTLVTYGRGVGVVIETAMKTEVGKIADIIENEEESETPLEKRLAQLGKTLGLIAIAVCAGIFLLGYAQGRDITDMLLTAVSLAVASIPEGLVAIVAVVLSIGVTTMSKKNAIIKRLPAVETLGSVDVVCSDKTGTLTQNRMTVTHYFTAVEGEVSVEDTSEHSEEGKLLAKAMILSSDATYENGVGTGDPTEIALLAFADSIGIDRKAIVASNDRRGEAAFDSERKLMSTLEDDNGRLRVFTKGAIDHLIDRCTRIRENGEIVSLTDDHKRKLEEATEGLSARALRTLAVAYKPVDREVSPEEMEEDLIMIGMVGMIDPPREEAKVSIQKAKTAGITTIMITGDHRNTAFAIAKELGIADDVSQVITGAELDPIPDNELAKRVSDFRVFARVSPEHKVKIVRAFKSKGHIVSMTGDGVNDAPSLNAADIGVAMGVTGTDVAKGAASMILTDDNFATIISAIEQGRNIYANIKKSVLFLLASNLGEVVAMVVCIIAGLPAPLIATQLLWINLLTDTLPAIALGMDPGDPDVMNQKPRNPREGFFADGAAFRVVAGGVLIGILTIASFFYGYYELGHNPFESSLPSDATSYARTMAFLTIIACQLVYSLSFRHDLKSIFSIGVFTNHYLIGAIGLGLLLQLLIISLPFTREAFKLQVIDWKGWVAIIALSFVPLLVNEIIKVFRRRNRLRQQSNH